MKFLYRFLLALFFLVWLGGMYLVFTTTQDLNHAAKMSVWLAQYVANPYFIVLFVGGLIAIMVIFWLPIWLKAYRQKRLYKRLKKEGVWASVPITFELTVSRVQIPRVGDLIDIFYDPKDPTLVVPAEY